ncbi:MAG TPA: transglycosylase SLT domain-containing protein [Candidatus Tectomicrobia bacterium]|nr:transglycosylase SLT domain-containing protein [Candidatus Tectomicrobia bacterium]
MLTKAQRGLMLCVVASLLVAGVSPAGSSTSALESAIQAAERGNYPEALAHLTALSPASLSLQERYRARYLYGHVALRLKQYPEALQAFGDVLVQYPDLGDYALWNAARIHQELNTERRYLEALRLLLARFPQSRLVPQVRLALGRQLIGVNGQLIEGARILEDLVTHHSKDASTPEAYLWLGQGYEEAGLRDKAAAAYRALYVRFPASPEAIRAAFRLETLLPGGAFLTTALSPRERLERADQLAEAGDCDRAMHEVRQFPAVELSEDLASWAARRLGFCAYRLRRYQEAIANLARFRDHQSSDERAAEAVYILGVALQRDGQTAEAERVFRQLAAREPHSVWNGKALVTLGLSYESRQELERAAATYRELTMRFPASDRADELAWRIGWLQYSQRSFSAAAREFAVAAERFPQSMFASNARFWQAKALDKSGHGPQALSLYEQVARDYPYTYYGLRAQEVVHARAPFERASRNARMAGGNFASTAGQFQPSTVEPRLSDAARFHGVRADELLTLRFIEDAREEIAHWAKGLGEGVPERALLARTYLRADMPPQAIRTLSSALSSVAAAERLSLPAEFWTSLFPMLYWEEVQEATKHTRLDPWLILGVIRQESAFSARAVSRSDARGLMQLLPSTGREVYQRSGLGPFRDDLLFDPGLNVRLGAQYLARLAETHRGNLILALAAYNAGPSRVKRWLQELSTADWDEFIERMPFEETRLYVKSVLRNYGVYQRLYAVAAAGQAAR